MTTLHLVEASELDRRAYADTLADILKRLGDHDQAADLETIEIFSQLRREVAAQIAELTDSPSAALYQRTLEGLDESMTTFANRWGLRFDILQQAGFNMGTELAVNPLEAGLDQTGVFDLLRGGPTTDQLRILTLFRTDLVGGLTDDLHRRIRMEVTGVAAGAKTASQAADAIGRNLTDRNHFSTIAHRARAIIATEVGRAQSLGTQAAQTEAARIVPGLRKSWLNAHLPGARQSHLEAEARYREGGPVGPIEVDEPYAVAGRDAMYPRDPSLPASETVHCHCVSISVMVEGLVTPAPVDPANPEPPPLTPADRLRQEEQIANLSPREAENRTRFDRLREPMVKPAGWDQMTKTKQLAWLEAQMEADFPIGVEFRDRAIIRRTETTTTPTGRKRRRTVTEYAPLTKGADLPTTFDLKDLNPEAAFASMNALRPLAVAFPEVAEHLTYVGSYRGVKGQPWKFRRGGMFNGEYAHASTDGRRIGLNPSHYTSLDTLADLTEGDWRTGFHPTAGVDSVIVHEFGHHVDNWIARNAGKSLLPADTVNGFGALGATMSEFRFAFTNPTRGGLPGYNELSRYATRNPAEGWAESFEAWWKRSNDVEWIGDSRSVFGPRIIRGARPIDSETYGENAETWLSRLDRFMGILTGTRLDNLPSHLDLPDVRDLSAAGRADFWRIHDQLLDDLGGPFGPYTHKSGEQ